MWLIATLLDSIGGLRPLGCYDFLVVTLLSSKPVKHSNRAALSKTI